MNQTLNRGIRHRMALPAELSALVAVLAGTAALAMTLITLAGEHMTAALIAGISAVLLNGWAVFAYRAAEALRDDHIDYLEARRDAVIYRTHYPLDRE